MMPTLVLKVVVAMVTTATLNTVKFITRGNSNNVDNDSHEHDEDHEPEKDCIKKTSEVGAAAAWSEWRDGGARTVFK